MTTLGDLAQKVRSKNAGPFWLTVDIFFDEQAAYARACASVSTDAVARALGTKSDQVKRFEIDDLRVLKFSLPRPAVQGTPQDRDMHGASYGMLISDLAV